LTVKDATITDFIDEIKDYLREHNADTAIGWVIGTLQERERMKIFHAIDQKKSKSLKDTEEFLMHQENINKINKNKTIKKQGYQNRITARETQIYIISIRKTLTLYGQLSVKQICKYSNIPDERYTWVYAKLKDMALTGELTKMANPKHHRQHLYVLTDKVKASNMKIITDITQIADPPTDDPLPANN